MIKKLSDIGKKLRTATPLRHLYKVLSREEKIQLEIKVGLGEQTIKLRDSDEYRYVLLRVYAEIKENLSKIAFSNTAEAAQRQTAFDKMAVFETIEEALLQKIEEGITARTKLKKDEELNARRNQ